MAKSTLIVGSAVPPPYLNAINGTDATTGHRHDNLDVDGSAPYVNLNLHTTAILFGSKYTVSSTQLIEFSFDGGVTYPDSYSFDLCKTGSMATLRVSPGVGSINGLMTTQANIRIRIVGGSGWPVSIFGNEPARSSLSSVTVIPDVPATGCSASFSSISDDILIIKGNGDPFLDATNVFFGDALTFVFVVTNSDLDT